MRFGCSVTLELLDAAAAVGCSFVELSTAVLLPERADGDTVDVLNRLCRASAPAEVWDLSLPEGSAVCGPSVEWPKITRHVYTVLRRASAVGGSVVGISCGNAFSVPRGFSHREALGQISDFFMMCGAVARKHGMVVGIEPRCFDRSVPIRSLPQAMEIARGVNSPGVGVLPNLSHIKTAGQSILDIADAAAWLAHVHVSESDLADRSDGSDLTPELWHALRLADYQGRVGIRGKWTGGAEDMAQALQALQSYLSPL